MSLKLITGFFQATCCRLQVKQALLLLVASQEEGIHTFIKHPDLATFWYKKVKARDEIKWPTWWLSFPDELVRDKECVERLKAVLQTEVRR